jgi:hypothetical protein
MDFEQWWETLTTREQNMIGVNNAEFVWGCAQMHLKDKLATAIQKMPFGNTSDSFAAYVRGFE